MINCGVAGGATTIGGTVDTGIVDAGIAVEGAIIIGGVGTKALSLLSDHATDSNKRKIASEKNTATAVYLTLMYP